MPSTTTIATADQLAEARNWIFDCFEDAPEDITDDEVIAGVERHCCGGWAGFLDLC
jgi:hypothetical protein